MTNLKVPPENPTGYAATAAELRRIADAIEPFPGRPFFTLYISPAVGADTDAEKVAAVDAVAVAILGRPGQPKKMSSGGWHHQAERTAAGITLSIHASISAPDPRDAEIERLKAENAKLREDCPAAAARADAEYAPAGRTTAVAAAHPDTLGLALGHHGGGGGAR